MKLVKTCDACPEQYDAINENDEQIGYLRLRHGSFTVSCPNALDTLVYKTINVKGDGEFFDDEREMFLKEAVQAIQRYYKQEPTGEYTLEDEWKE